MTPFILNDQGHVSFRNNYAIRHTIDHQPQRCVEALNTAAADEARTIVFEAIREHADHIEGIAVDVLANRIGDRVWRLLAGRRCPWEPLGRW